MGTASPPATPRSFFALELQYAFDGARDDALEMFCYVEPDHVRSCIRQVVNPHGRQPLDAFLLAFSTDRFGGQGWAILFRVEEGTAVDALLLHDFVRVTTEDGSAPLRAARTNEDVASLEEQEARVEIDWTPIDAFLARAAKRNPLRRGEVTRFQIPTALRKATKTIYEGEEITQGFQDLVYGEDVAREFVDPTV